MSDLNKERLTYAAIVLVALGLYLIYRPDKTPEKAEQEKAKMAREHFQESLRRYRGEE